MEEETFSPSKVVIFCENAIRRSPLFADTLRSKFKDLNIDIPVEFYPGGIFAFCESPKTLNEYLRDLPPGTLIVTIGNAATTLLKEISKASKQLVSHVRFVEVRGAVSTSAFAEKQIEERIIPLLNR